MSFITVKLCGYHVKGAQNIQKIKDVRPHHIEKRRLIAATHICEQCGRPAKYIVRADTEVG